MLINSDSPTDKPETDQMKVIHRAMRREFALLPPLVAAVPAGDTTRAGLLGAHARLMLGMLHEHHEAEDTLLWPLLRRRTPLQTQLVGTMETQHQALAGTITAVEPRLRSWTETAGATERDALAAGLRELDTALVEHLSLEEEAVLPLIHEHLTVREWLAPQKHAMKHGPRALTDKLLLCGVVLEDSTERERAWFLAEMPAPARALWRMIGARRYAEHRRAVRADAPGW